MGWAKFGLSLFSTPTIKGMTGREHMLFLANGIARSWRRASLTSMQAAVGDRRKTLNASSEVRLMLGHRDRRARRATLTSVAMRRLGLATFAQSLCGPVDDRTKVEPYEVHSGVRSSVLRGLRQSQSTAFPLRASR